MILSKTFNPNINDLFLIYLEPQIKIIGNIIEININENNVLLKNFNDEEIKFLLDEFGNIKEQTDDYKIIDIEKIIKWYWYWIFYKLIFVKNDKFKIIRFI